MEGRVKFVDSRLGETGLDAIHSRLNNLIKVKIHRLQFEFTLSFYFQFFSMFTYDVLNKVDFKCLILSIIGLLS